MKNTKTTKRKRTTPSVGIYLDDTTNDRFSIAIMKEREKQIKKGDKPTFTKSGLCRDLLEKWMKQKNY